MKDENKKNKWKNYIILSNYVLLPPRRLKDYALMYVIEEDEEQSKDMNYYIKGKGEYIFNNYKTSENYGSQKIILNEEHKGILENYIKKYGIIGSLLGLEKKTISERLSRIFKKRVGKNVRVNILRHSYITHLTNIGYLNKKRNRKIIANIMAHSIAMQQEYYKDEKKLENENEIKYEYEQNEIKEENGKMNRTNWI